MIYQSRLAYSNWKEDLFSYDRLYFLFISITMTVRQWPNSIQNLHPATQSFLLSCTIYSLSFLSSQGWLVGIATIDSSDYSSIFEKTIASSFTCAELLGKLLENLVYTGLSQNFLFEKLTFLCNSFTSFCVRIRLEMLEVLSSGCVSQEYRIKISRCSVLTWWEIGCANV